MRALEGFIHLTSHRGGARVVLIHPAEALNLSAANALLKSLEEPPPRTYFLLVAHRWHYLLPTIRSRCRLVALPLPEAGAALAWLRGQKVAEPELALAHAGGAPLSAAGLDPEYWSVRDAGAGFARLAGRSIRSPRPRNCATCRPTGWWRSLQKWSYRPRARSGPPDGCATIRTARTALAALAARLDRLETARLHRRMVGLQRVVRHPLNARLFLEVRSLLDLRGHCCRGFLLNDAGRFALPSRFSRSSPAISTPFSTRCAKTA